MIRDQFHAFAEEKVVPFAHGWHLRDELIPMELVRELGDLGVFGLTIPEEYDGAGLGKTAMCVVSEELSRAWIGVGSLATRSEIAAELILTGGTADQKTEWLPKIASAEILAPKSCRRPCSPNLIPGPTWAACARGPSSTATGMWSPGTRPGSPTRPGRT